MKSLPMMESVRKLESASFLDPAAKKLRKVANSVLRQRDLADLLHGVPFGHPVHPVLVQIPIGAWTSASVLDLLPGQEKASAVLVGTGIAAALPAVASGYADWSQTDRQTQRVGVVHMAVNTLGTSLYAISLLQRCTGRHTAGKMFSAAGLAIVSAGGFLGGHLSFRQGAGVSRVIGVEQQVPSGWHSITSLDSLTEGKLERRLLGETPLVLLRRGEKVHALANTCSHWSGPLNEGQLIDDGGDPCVQCPWHKSVFSLRSGEVIHGPATAAQPRFETRVVDGYVEVSLASA